MTSQDFEKIKKVLKFVWENPHSDFYRKKYEAAGFNPASALLAPGDFERVPFLLREELAQTHPEERLFFPPGGMWHLLSTSGTSRQKPAFFYRRSVPAPKPHSPFFSEKSRVLLLTLPSRVNIYSNDKMSVQASEGRLVVGDVSNLPATAYQAAYLAVDTIIGTPTLLLEFAPHLAKHYDLSHVRLLRCRGENLTPLRMQKLQEFYPQAELRAGYALAEIGPLGRQCAELGSSLQTISFFHVLEDEYLESGPEGELIFTPLLVDKGFGTPLIRYRTGDQVKFLEEKCRCQDKQPLFKIEGRIGLDYLKVSGGAVVAGEVEKAIQELGGAEDYLLHVWEAEDQGQIKIKLVLEIVPRDKSAVLLPHYGELFSQKLKVGAHTTLSQAVKLGFFSSPEVRQVKQIPRVVSKHLHIANHLHEKFIVA